MPKRGDLWWGGAVGGTEVHTEVIAAAVQEEGNPLLSPPTRGTSVDATVARTSPQRDVAVASRVSLGGSSYACVLNSSAWGSGGGSAAVQPTRNTQADGAPKVPGASAPPRSLSDYPIARPDARPGTRRSCPCDQPKRLIGEPDCIHQAHNGCSTTSRAYPG
jgi:hypothetical protein